MTFLILGGTGYLGRKLTASLIQEGHRVICLAREASKLDGLPLGDPRFQICMINGLGSLLCEEGSSIDWFVNLSCRYVRKGVSEREIWESNLLVPMNCLLLCKQYGVHQCLTIGTGLPDDFNTYCKSKALFAEIGRYYTYRDRLQGEQSLFYHVKLENFYGEDEPNDRFLHRVIRSLLLNEDVLLTEGTQHRDFIYVDDVIQGLSGLMVNPPEDGFVEIPLGSGEAPSIRELIEFLKDETHSRSRLRFGAVPMRVNEPDSIADREKMQGYGIRIEWSWRNGMRQLLRRYPVISEREGSDG